MLKTPLNKYWSCKVKCSALATEDTILKFTQMGFSVHGLVETVITQAKSSSGPTQAPPVPGSMPAAWFLEPLQLCIAPVLQTEPRTALQALSILSRGAGLEASPQPNLEWPGNTEPLCYTGLTCSWGLVAHCVQGRSWRLHIWAGNSRDIKPTQKQKAHWWISSMLLFQEIFLGKILFFPPLETEGVQWCAEASLESSR